MTTVVSVLNMKGGVGKTTLTHNLALAGGYLYDLNVLVVDLDPQFNISQSLMTESRFREEIVEKGKPTIVDIFEKDRPRMGAAAAGATGAANPIVSIVNWQNAGSVDLVPSRLEFAWTLQNPAGKERYLKNFLSRQKNRYDLVLIDCPPTESMATHAAYLASDSVLVPVKPEFLAAIGLPLLATSLATFHGLYDDHHVNVAGVVFNDVNESYEHYRAKDDVASLAAENGWYVFQNQLSHSDSYPKGTRVRTPITWTDYARQTKKDEFGRFLAEFLDRVGVESRVPS